MTKVTWKDSFKKQIKDAEALYAQEATSVSFLLFCLRTKKFTSREYLDWAREAHQIPVLSEKFFAQRPPSAELYQKYQAQYAWSPECLPVAEWEGQLIVACLERPEDFKGTAIFVLTSYENLEKTWAGFQVSQREDSFFNVDGSLVLKDDVVESSFEKSEDSSVSESSSPGLVAGEDSGGIPDGLFGDVMATGPSPAVSLNNFVGVKLEPLKPAPAAKSAAAADDAVPFSIEEAATAIHRTISGVEYEPDEAVLEAPAGMHELKLMPVDENSQPSIKPQTAPPPRQEPAVSAMHEEMLRKGPRTTHAVGAIDTLPMDDVEDEENMSTQKRAALGAANVTGEVPKAPVKFTQSPVIGAAAYFLEKVRKQNQEQFDREVVATFNQFKTYFKKTMLLAIGDKDRVVKPLMWEGNEFDVRKPALQEFSLKIPSIFRIVSGTQKPYHGYIVPNDLNGAFFDSWNHGQIPEHVTIVPILDHDLVVGMLIGFGEKSSYTQNVLQFSENTARELSRKIIRPSARAA
jgi:hypothetical protein